MKRENQSGGSSDDGNGSPTKRFRRNEDTVRLLIPSKIAGAIIGKGGQHINRLRSQYKATINIEDCQGPERTVLITSEFDNILKIIEEMLKNFEEQKDGEIDLRTLIHQSLAGCVIGKGGSKIKEIRDKIGCRILKVFSNVAPQSTDRVVQCVGNPGQCLDAFKEIIEMIKPMPIKGSTQNYDPINYDDRYADEYGGFGAGGGGRMNGNGGGRFDRRGGGGGDNDRFRDRRNGSNDRRDGGRSGNRDNGPSRSRDREFIDPWAPNAGPMNTGGFNGLNSNNMMANTMGNLGNAVNPLANNLAQQLPVMGNNLNSLGNLSSMVSNGMAGNLGVNLPNNNTPTFITGNGSLNSMGNNNGLRSGNGSNNDEGKNTTQVTIPKDLAGAIIGKAGNRIRRIRMDSNAFITIDEPLPGSTDRIITITGTPKEIQMAQYLLQQSVHEHRRKF